jgi:hypothetical protein
VVAPWTVLLATEQPTSFRQSQLAVFFGNEADFPPFLQIRGAAEPPNPTQFFIRKVLVVVRQYFELDRRGGGHKENANSNESNLTNLWATL